MADAAQSFMQASTKSYPLYKLKIRVFILGLETPLLQIERPRIFYLVTFPLCLDRGTLHELQGSLVSAIKPNSAEFAAPGIFLTRYLFP